jgi:hypothetical protein
MDNREVRAERIDRANEKWVESISAMPAEEAKKGLNEIIYSVLHDFSDYERKILIRALFALEKRIPRRGDLKMEGLECVVCGGITPSGYKFCGNCGQCFRRED